MTVDKSHFRSVQRWDRLARLVITVGGVAVIISVIVILLLIVSEALPLFYGARSDRIARFTLRPDDVDRPMGVGIGEYLENGLVIDKSGDIVFLALKNGVAIENLPLRKDLPEGVVLREVETLQKNRYGLVWTDGVITLADAVFRPEFDEAGNRSIRRTVVTRARIDAPEGDTPVAARIRQFVGDNEAIAICVMLMPDNSFYVHRSVTTSNFLGEEETTSGGYTIPALPGASISAFTVDTRGRDLYAGTDDGTLVWWRLQEGAAEKKNVIPAFPDKRRITALQLVFGGVSLAVGDELGEYATWFAVRTGEEQGGRKLRLIHRLRPHTGPIRTIFPSRRNKSLVSVSSGAQIHLDHMTSERALLTLTPARPISHVSFSSRDNGIIAVDEGRQVTVWSVHNPHPEISFRTLFGKVWYEGGAGPEYSWQSSASTDDYEPKLNLTPLLFGTFKGTVYAMLFAVPLALFGAVYTSQFTTHDFKKVIKPTVEIMAAVPSVVIGFLIALWLAPIVKEWIIAVFLSFATVPLAFLGFLLFWSVIRDQDWAKRVEKGYEFFLLFPVVIAGVLIAAALNGPVESIFFGGDFAEWIYRVSDGEMAYDQRNCLIIAFGLGFAVIPIIFSIAEDSLSNVPYSLSAASLALGASRWQTVSRVVLPSASPGIFAAIMIGFGRAIGETMIVLMATGNTPVMDWNIFNGMRTLSANIAVEIPEAPVGGTLYRVLFLCAVVLFTLTFFLNTVAELVRHSLRKRFGRF